MQDGRNVASPQVVLQIILLINFSSFRFASMQTQVLLSTQIRLPSRTSTWRSMWKGSGDWCASSPSTGLTSLCSAKTWRGSSAKRQGPALPTTTMEWKGETAGVAVSSVNYNACQWNCSTKLHCKTIVWLYCIHCTTLQYYNNLYAADEGLRGRNVLQSVVNWYYCVIAHKQFSYAHQRV